MKRYGLIGEKLGHSHSPFIHKKLFGYDYSLIEIPKDKIAEFLTKKEFNAINVTIPYKQTVIPFLDEISKTAKEIGAVNTVVNKNGKLYGYNTDFTGLCALIEKNNLEISGKCVAILGSGGTSKTAKAVAKSLGAKKIYTVSHSGNLDCITYEKLYEIEREIEVIINTTPCGMYPNINESAVDLNKFTNLYCVIDAIYNPLKTKLVCDALNAGIKAIGGLYMLVAQAAAAAEKFVEKKVSNEAVESIFNELYKNKENIVLIGMPGSGKTTIGKKLSQILSKDFIDTDELIVNKENTPIPEIFKTKGEAGFRDIESSIIKEVSALHSKVIATGGGAVLREENINLLKQNGKIIFLDRELENILPTADRPLSSNIADLKKRFKERFPVYCSSCDIHIKCCENINDNIALILKELEL